MLGDYYLECTRCGVQLLVPKIFHECPCPKCRRVSLIVVYVDLDGTDQRVFWQVAQLVERHSDTVMGGGSNPPLPTKRMQQCLEN